MPSSQGLPETEVQSELPSHSSIPNITKEQSDTHAKHPELKEPIVFGEQFRGMDQSQGLIRY